MTNQNIKIDNLRVEGESTIKGDFVLDISESLANAAGEDITDRDISEAEYSNKLSELFARIDSGLARISQKQKDNAVLNTELNSLLADLEQRH